jgi:hypothetical protein
VQAVVDAQRGEVTPSPLVLACVERELAPLRQEAVMRCRR